MLLEEYAAAVVLIECPVTHALVPTGTMAERAEQLPLISLLIDCPDCAQDHLWRAADGVLAH